MDAKKMLAPIVVTVILILYFACFLLGILKIPEPTGFKLLGIIIPVIFMGFSLKSLIDRIKELRSGEEDDLSKY